MKLKITLIWNIAIVIMVAIAWCMMVFSVRDGMLASRGLYAMKYFTVLSNMLEGIASIAYAWALVRTLRHGRTISREIHLLKYVSAVAVGLTFATVMLFLGPLYGYGAMFRGANLAFHLLVPVAAMIEFCVFDIDYPLPLKTTLIACIPMLLYGIAYYANIVINGVGEWPNTNDWYGFTAAGTQWTPLVFAIMLLATWVIAALLRVLNQRMRTRN